VPTLEALRGQRARLRSRLGALEQALDGDLAELEERPAKAG
jgi:hypothetical protein